MSSIFKIQQELETKLHEIELYAEENEGDISEELLNELQISEDTLYEKLEDYRKAIAHYKNNVTEIKDEKARLTNLQKVRENRVKRLNEVITTAVIKFGNLGKTGNFNIELDDCKMFTRSTTAIEENAIRIENLQSYVLDYCKELYKEQILTTGDSIDLGGFVQVINNLIYSESELAYGKEFAEQLKPYTISDFEVLDANIHINITLAKLMQHPYLIQLYFESEGADDNYDIKMDFTPDKKLIRKYEEDEITISEKVTNVSTTIK